MLGDRPAPLPFAIWEQGAAGKLMAGSDGSPERATEFRTGEYQLGRLMPYHLATPTFGLQFYHK